MKTPIEFRKTWKSYVKGDIAGFAPDIAEKLITSSIATAYTGPLPDLSEDAGAAEQAEAQAARTAALDAREAELARREQEMAAKEAQGTAGGDDKKSDAKKAPAKAPTA